MSALTLYIKPTCSTCRKALALLDELGVPYKTVRYYDQPLGTAKISELVDKAGGDVRPFLRTKAPQYRELGLDDTAKSRSEIVEALAREPDLFQRPIAELGDRAIVARPPELLVDFVDQKQNGA